MLVFTALHGILSVCQTRGLYIQLYSPIYMVAEIRKTTEKKERKKPCYCTND